MTGLAPNDAAALADHEAAIEAARDGFVEQTTDRLLDIRQRRLYRAAFDTFEDYCQQRWGLTRRHVNRMIQHAEVVAIVGPTGPTNEAQARELAPLLDQPEVLRDAWDQAQKQTGGKPTAAAIRGIVRPPISPPSMSADTSGGGDPVKVTRTERTVEEFIADRQTGEVQSVEDWQAAPEPKWQPSPPSAHALAAEQRRISNEAWSRNLARWANSLARLDPDSANAAMYVSDFDPASAVEHGGVDRRTLRCAAHFLLALADVWKDEAA